MKLTAEKVKWSSVVGQVITLHDESGKVTATLSVRNADIDKDWKLHSEAVADVVVAAINGEGRANGRGFCLGDRVTKTKGSQWTGRVVGFYSTELTPFGYAVESETERGSVQIYPGAALKGCDA